MSDIDLELVELRCKLRGYEMERRPDGSILITDESDADANGARYVASRGGRAGDKWHAQPSMIAPRLTLADIIAAPGEGWTVALKGVEVTELRWTGEGGPRTPDARVSVYPSGFVEVSARGGGGTLRLLAAHRAVVDLLVRLGEVAP